MNMKITHDRLKLSPLTGNFSVERIEKLDSKTNRNPGFPVSRRSYKNKSWKCKRIISSLYTGKHPKHKNTRAHSNNEKHLPKTPVSSKTKESYNNDKAVSTLPGKKGTLWHPYEADFNCISNDHIGLERKLGCIVAELDLSVNKFWI